MRGRQAKNLLQVVAASVYFLYKYTYHLTGIARMAMKIRALAALVLGLFAAQFHATPVAEAASKKPAVAKPAAKQATQSPSSRNVGKAVPPKQASKSAPAPVAKAAPNRSATRKAAVVAGAAASTAALAAPESNESAASPNLASSAFLVTDLRTGEVLLERNSSQVLPIASITKLMTAMVVLESGLPLSEELVITEADVDTLKGSSSRIPVGTRLTREEMLRLALMSSENRAASALGRNYPGGIEAFVSAMNAKARLLGLHDTRFMDSTGLNPGNVSSPHDLARMVSAAANYPLIRTFSTETERQVVVRGRTLQYRNTNALVKDPEWEIGLSKTGFIREAGRCLVMQAWMLNRPLAIVLMDSNGRYTRTADAERVKRWLETHGTHRVAATPRGLGG